MHAIVSTLASVKFTDSASIHYPYIYLHMNKVNEHFVFIVNNIYMCHFHVAIHCSIIFTLGYDVCLHWGLLYDCASYTTAVVES